MTRNQQLMVMSAEIAMSLGLIYKGYQIYKEEGFDDKLALVVHASAGLYLAYGAYLNYQGRIQLLPGD